jgi:hypothetical protein
MISCPFPPRSRRQGARRERKKLVKLCVCWTRHFVKQGASKPAWPGDLQRKTLDPAGGVVVCLCCLSPARRKAHPAGSDHASERRRRRASHRTPPPAQEAGLERSTPGPPLLKASLRVVQALKGNGEKDSLLGPDRN